MDSVRVGGFIGLKQPVELLHLICNVYNDAAGEVERNNFGWDLLSVCCIMLDVK